MTVGCKDRERIFLDGTAEEWTSLQLHAISCAECAEELRAWDALSMAAAELRDYQENPALWSRIEASLAEQTEQPKGVRNWWKSFSFWRQIPNLWQMSLAGALVLVLALIGGYILVKRNAQPELAHNGFLKDRALLDVERTEREYMKAIDKLAVEAKPQLDSSTSPLMASYQEKLMVLDSAIDDLRVQAGKNPSNAHLRYQLLAMYRDKETTLQDILETK